MRCARSSCDEWMMFGTYKSKLFIAVVTLTVITMLVLAHFQGPVVFKHLKTRLTNHVSRANCCQSYVSMSTDSWLITTFGKWRSNLAHTTLGREITSQSLAIDGKGLGANVNKSLICETPRFDPFDKSVLRFIKKVGKVNCEPTKYLISEVNDTGYLILHSKRLRSLIGSANSICSYNTFVRDNDNKRVHSNDTTLVPDKAVKISTDFTRVRCFVEKKLVYINLHATISDKKSVVAKMRSSQTEVKNEKQNHPAAARTMYSVLMIGFDGLSRANALRQLPKTYEYFTKKMAAITLTGYNAVGDNTYPNLVPLLCGKNESQVPKKGGRLATTIPFIWKRFAENNYVTLYTEDQFYATFNYLTSGFTKAPTDYYQRPFWEERDATAKIMKQQGIKSGRCFNGKTIFEFMLDWVKLFAKKFANSAYFSFSFLNDLSHYSLNDIQIADDYLYEFFKTLHENGFLKNVIVMFLSDHGNRYSAIRQTPIGRAEHALPLMAIHFPETFRKSYPGAIENVRENANRLTTPYDIHATLMDIVSNNFSSRHYEKDQRGLSLFGTVPDDRECKTCGVPETYCRCDELYPIDVDSPKAVKAAALALKQIQSKLEPHSALCETLKFSKIHSAFQYGDRGKNLDNNLAKTPNMTTNMVVFETLPGRALFEANVKLPFDLQSPELMKKSSVIGDINRINKYGDQSLCIKDKNLRLYCYCKDYKGE